MATGDIKLTFSFPLAAIGAQVKVGDASAGQITAPASAGTVS